MKTGTVMGQVIFFLLVVSVCCVIGLWVAYDDLRNRHADICDELEDARLLKRKFVELQDLHTTMACDLKDVRESLRTEEGKSTSPDSKDAPASVSLSALGRMAAMLEQQNEELGTKLAAAQNRIDKMTGDLTRTKAELNQATINLAKLKSGLDGKTKASDGLKKALADLRKQHDKSIAEKKGLESSVASVKGELAKVRKDLVGTKLSLTKKTKEADDFRSQLAKLQGKFRASTQKGQSDVAKLKKNVVGVRESLNAANSSLSAVRKNLKTKTTLASSLQTKLTSIEVKLQVSDKESADLEKSLAVMEGNRAKLLAANKALDERVKKLSAQESEYIMAISKLKTQFEDADERAKAIQKQLDELKKKSTESKK